MTSFTGGCLCGAVRYECNAEPVMSAHCYCEDCRRSSGTSHCSHVVVPKAALSVSGDYATYDRPADSGNIVTRAFCGTCGAAVFSTNSGIAEMIFPRASSLDDLEVCQPSMAVYTSRAPSWDPPSAGLMSFPEMPPPAASPVNTEI